MLDVLKDERVGLVVLDDVRDFEKQVSLFLVIETVLFAEAQLLRNSGDAERLSGKTRAEDVVLWNIGDCYGMNVAVRLLAEVRFVCDLSVLVPFR